jgi:hypothetical protein
VRTYPAPISCPNVGLGLRAKTYVCAVRSWLCQLETREAGNPLEATPPPRPITAIRGRGVEPGYVPDEEGRTYGIRHRGRIHVRTSSSEIANRPTIPGSKFAAVAPQPAAQRLNLARGKPRCIPMRLCRTPAFAGAGDGFRARH